MIWLIGCKGMLGQEIALVLEKNHLDFFATDSDVDICDIKQLENFTKDKKIQWIINCAAYTAVDQAEKDIKQAHLLNEIGPANIAETAKNIGAKLIHFSTDYVFDGLATSPIAPTAKTNPQSVYGSSKLAGELRIQQTFTDYFIIRISWLYGFAGNNFVKTMISLMNSQKDLSIVHDQRGAPTYTEALAKNIQKLIQHNSQNFGLYHYTDKADISWYDFSCEIFSQAKKLKLITSDCAISKTTTDKFPRPAPRPAYSVLDTSLTETILDFEITPWQDNLKKLLIRLKENS